MASFSEYFFKWAPVNKIILGSFGWASLMAVIFFVPFLRVWWWVFFPLILSVEVKKLYLWWLQWDYKYAEKKWVVLEIVLPKETLVPLKAMEDVFTVMWGPLFDEPSWREKWCEGTLLDAPEWMSFEIASIEGQLHFYIRVTTAHRLTIETILYNHYPELEIHEVQDYVKNVPQNMPNEEWNTYGEDYVLGKKPEAYPIKTYEKFFEPQGERISAEEKRIDPIASLLELMSKLGTGEQFWLQFIISSGKLENLDSFKNDAQKEIAKITKRPVKQKKTFLEDMGGMLFHLVYGPKKEGSGDKASYKWIESAKTEEGNDKELLLTPGERELLTEIENKMKKPVFRTNIRGVYVAKRSNFNSSNRILARSYFAHFQSSSLNFIKFYKATRPKTQFFLRKTIPLVRVRRMFRNYVLRFFPLFPNREAGCSMLNPEELATLYHFPFKITGLVAPTMARVDSKKGGPPHNLPME